MTILQFDLRKLDFLTQLHTARSRHIQLRITIATTELFLYYCCTRLHGSFQIPHVRDEAIAPICRFRDFDPIWTIFFLNSMRTSRLGLEGRASKTSPRQTPARGGAGVCLGEVFARSSLDGRASKIA